MERHFVNLLLDYIQAHSPLSPLQWGFTSGKSATSALLHAVDAWHKFLVEGTDICIVFFDYCKAFDSIPHRALTVKLKAFGINEYIVNWLISYLCDRNQYVSVNGSSSDLCSVTSGVPQGSELGPILFIIYVNGIGNVSLTAGTTSLFADDIMLYRPIYCPTDYSLLQTDIDDICSWTSDNLLEFSVQKCKYMIISHKKQLQPPPNDLCVNGLSLERVHEYKYLGVWLTSGLTWSKHINTICNKAKQKIGILYRKYYQHASTASMLQVYLACIRPDLEYAAPVWSPHQQGLKDQIEGVQKLALKICTKQWTTSYSTLLTLTRVPSLEKRRQILKLCYIFKILNNIYTFPEPQPLQLQSNGGDHRTRSHNRKLVVPFARTNSYQFSFFCHTPRLWNELPSKFVQSTSAELFKERLSIYLNNTHLTL